MDYPLRLVDQLREHLRALRRQRGLTQAQLGQRLGLSQVRIAEIEAEPAVVSVDQIMRILSALGATLVLRDMAAEPSGATDPAQAPTTPAQKPRRHIRATASDKTDTPSTPPGPPVLTPKKGSW